MKPVPLGIRLCQSFPTAPGDTADALGNAGVHVAGVEFDSLLASFVLDATRRSHGLDHLARELLAYEMIPISGDLLGEDQLKYLKENMECEGLVHDGTVISVELPQFVELEVTQTDPGFKGDTAQGGTKPATLETGAVIQVPLFIEMGDVVKVDRKEDKYLTRASS